MYFCWLCMFSSFPYCAPPLIRHYHLLTTYLYKVALMVRGCAGFTPVNPRNSGRAWGCRVRLEQLACRPLAPIWGRCSLRRRALTAVARVGVRSANDSERTLDDLIDDSTGIHLMAETEVCQLKPSWPHTLCTSGRGSGVDLSEGSGSGSG